MTTSAGSACRSRSAAIGSSTPMTRKSPAGIFTAALPAAIAPGRDRLPGRHDQRRVRGSDRLGYGGDRCASGGNGSSRRLPRCERPAAAVGVGGGLRVTGRVQNEGTTATRWVMAGALVLAAERPAAGSRLRPERCRPAGTGPDAGVRHGISRGAADHRRPQREVGRRGVRDGSLGAPGHRRPASPAGC